MLRQEEKFHHFVLPEREFLCSGPVVTSSSLYVLRSSLQRKKITCDNISFGEQVGTQVGRDNSRRTHDVASSHTGRPQGDR